jgi:hypothetical protein
LDALAFAFDVFEHMERTQPKALAPKNFMNFMADHSYIAALVTGTLDAVGDPQDDHRSLTALLALLEKLLALWAATCGLDFATSCVENRICTAGTFPPLFVSWRTKRENGPAIVDLLLRHGYKPCIWFVRL